MERLKWIDHSEKAAKHQARVCGFFVGKTGGLFEIPPDIPASYHKDWEEGWYAGVKQIPKSE